MSETRKTHIKTFLLWFPLVSISIYIGLLLSSPLGEFLHNLRGVAPSASDDGFVEGNLALLFLVGLLMGVSQWLVINTRLKNVRNWISATLIGFSVSGFTFYMLAVLLASILSIFDVGYYPVDQWAQVSAVMVAGMFTGAFQWLSLKRQLAGSIKWSLITGLSFSIGAILGVLFSREQSMSPIFFSLGFGFISGIFVEPLIIRPGVEFPNQQNASYRLTAVCAT
jgi:hypothetical protein